MPFDEQKQREYMARWSIEQAVSAGLVTNSYGLIAAAKDIYKFVEGKTMQEEEKNDGHA
jgi:hypothetical protein